MGDEEVIEAGVDENGTRIQVSQYSNRRPRTSRLPWGYKALAKPGARGIVMLLLQNGPLKPRTVMERLDVTQNTSNYHLQVLEKARIIRVPWTAGRRDPVELVSPEDAEAALEIIYPGWSANQAVRTAAWQEVQAAIEHRRTRLLEA